MIWEAADRICGKRLKAALPNLVESMERHGHLDLDPQVRRRLLAASASTLDRVLKPIRATAGSRRKRRRRPSMGGQVPVRTFADWNKSPPGFLEIDFVVHCGGPLSGSFIHSLVATGVCTGWTEAVPLLVREQSLVVEGLEAIGRLLPFPIRGIDSDNGSAFINETLIRWCNERGIEFTRSRAYRKNGQAWIEQKHGAAVRRFVGYDRYSGPVAGQTMAHLYGAVRLYVNYFQPSFKLVEKTRDGASVVKRYSPPATPCDRLMQHGTVSAKLMAKLSESRAGLDPVALLHTIREAQSALVAVTSPDFSETPHGESLDRFLAGLPSLCVRVRRALLIRRGYALHAIGELERIPLRGYGATCCSGCRATRTLPPRRCWNGSGPTTPAASPTPNYAHCSAECSNGAASWLKSWSPLRPVNPGRSSMKYRN